MQSQGINITAGQPMTPEVIRQIYDQAFSLASQSLTVGIGVGLVCGCAITLCAIWIYLKWDGVI